MKKIAYTLLFAAFVSLMSSCGEKKEPFVLPSDVKISPVPIQRLDRQIENYLILDSLQRAEFITSNFDALKGFGQFVDAIDTVNNSIVTSWATWPATTVFMPLVNKAYPNLNREELALGRILETAKHNQLEIKPDKFAAVTWGSPKSIVIIDTIGTVYIALNHYLGAESDAYNGWPSYKRTLKEKRMIPVDVAEALVATAYPYSPAGNPDVLSRLLYEGVLTVAKKAMVPEATDAEILGLSDEDLAAVVENQSFIWQQLLKGNKLYSTDSELMSNLFDMRPKTTVVSPDAPGRSARYIGYSIVRDYIEKNPDTELKFLLSADFYDDGTIILRQTEYSPK